MAAATQDCSVAALHLNSCWCSASSCPSQVADHPHGMSRAHPGTNAIRSMLNHNPGTIGVGSMLEDYTCLLVGSDGSDVQPPAGVVSGLVGACPCWWWSCPAVRHVHGIGAQGHDSPLLAETEVWVRVRMLRQAAERFFLRACLLSCTRTIHNTRTALVQHQPCSMAPGMIVSHSACRWDSHRQGLSHGFPCACPCICCPCWTYAGAELGFRPAHCLLKCSHCARSMLQAS